MLPKFKQFIKLNKFYILLFLVIFGFTSTAIKYTNTIVTKQVLAELQRNHEQKSWETLKLFQATTQEALVDQMEHTIDTLNALAKDPFIVAALENNDLAELSEILYRQRDVNKHFDAFMVLDKNGIGIANATDAPNKEALLGKDYSTQGFFQFPLKNLSTYISGVKKSSGTNNYVMAVSTPILDTRGNLEYVLVASIRAKNITKRITIDNKTNDYSFVLADSTGTLIYDGTDIIDTPPNLTTDDRVIQRLANGETEVTEQEMNYKKERVLAYGAPFNILNEKFLLVTYYPTQKFELENQTAINSVKYSLLKIVYVDYALAATVFVLVVGLALEHAKKETRT